MSQHIIDDFNDGDLSEYDGSTGEWSIVDESTLSFSAVNGPNILNGQDAGSIVSTSGLDNYFQKGEVADSYVRFENVSDALLLRFGLSDADNNYHLQLNTDDFVRLRKEDGGSISTFDTIFGFGWQTGIWWRVRVIWDDGSLGGAEDDITVEFYKGKDTDPDSNSPYETLTGNDSTFASNDGVGFETTSGGSTEWYIDNINLPNQELTISATALDPQNVFPTQADMRAEATEVDGDTDVTLEWRETGGTFTQVDVGTISSAQTISERIDTLSAGVEYEYQFKFKDVSSGETVTTDLVSFSTPAFLDEWRPRRASSEADYSRRSLQDNQYGSGTFVLDADAADNHAVEWTRPADAADVDILALTRIPEDTDDADSWTRVYARADDATDQYGYSSVYLDGGTPKLRVRLEDSGNVIDIGTVSLANTAASSAFDTWMWRRFRVSGDRWRLRVWDATDAEPAGWDIDGTSSQISSAGYTGFGGVSSDPQQLDYFSVASGGETAVLPPRQFFWSADQYDDGDNETVIDEWTDQTDTSETFEIGTDTDGTYLTYTAPDSSDNALRFEPGGTAGLEATDTDVWIRYKIVGDTSSDGINLWWGSRWQSEIDPTSWDWLIADTRIGDAQPGEFGLRDYVSGTDTDLGSTSATFTTGTLAESRVTAAADSVEARWWDAFSDEPDTADLSATTTVTEAGAQGVGMTALGDAELRIYAFGVGTNGATAPTQDPQTIQLVTNADAVSQRALHERIADAMDPTVDRPRPLVGALALSQDASTIDLNATSFDGEVARVEPSEPPTITDNTITYTFEFDETEAEDETIERLVAVEDLDTIAPSATGLLEANSVDSTASNTITVQMDIEVVDASEVEVENTS